MGKDTIELKLDLLIYHLERLPQRIFDELAVREKIKEQNEIFIKRAERESKKQTLDHLEKERRGL